MNRKDFFKKLGAGVVVAAIAPKVLADIKPGKVGPHGIPFVDVSRIPDGWTIEDVLKEWERTGVIVTKLPDPFIDDMVAYKGMMYLVIEQNDNDILIRSIEEGFDDIRLPRSRYDEIIVCGSAWSENGFSER